MQSTSIQRSIRLLRMASAAAVVLSAAVGSGVSASAQTLPSIDAGTGPLGLLLPKLSRAPAPAWVRPGVRLTYYGASATVAGAGKEWKIDPEGGFQTPDGQRWSGADKVGGAGQGFTLYDIVGAGADKVAMATSSYVLIPGSAPSLSTTGVAFGNPGAAGDLWANPDVLKKLANRSGGGLHVYRAPYKIGGESKRSVWIYTTTSSGNTLYIYEEATGLMIHYSSATSGGPSPVIGSTEGSNTPNAFLVTATLVAKRNVAPPWANDPPPSWVAGIHSLDFSGTTTTFIPGSPSLNLPASSRMTVASRGPGWVRFKTVFTLGGGRGAPGQTSQTDAISGAYALGVWINPRALAKLRPGQQIDHDPATGVSVTVSQPASTPRGKTMTVITISNAVDKTDLGYDQANGMLVYVNQVQRVPPAVNQTRIFLNSSQ
jgi:hypothetical protein